MSTILSTSILNHLDAVAVFTGGLFAGTALYLSIGEVPALQEFGLNEHWRILPHVLKTAGIAQVSYTLISGIAGIVHGIRIVDAPSQRYLWIASGATFIAIIPYTLICIGPINRTIFEDNKSVKSGNESQLSMAKKKELLNTWAALHFVRTVGSVAAFSAMVFGLSRHSSFF